MALSNDIPHSLSKPTIGIIVGTGFNIFSEIVEARRVKIQTKYGSPSSDIFIGNYEGVPVAYLYRHGENHELPPHKIPYKANIAALKAVGVKYIFASCMAGSLKKKIKPGDVVVVDQFVHFTWGRDNSFEADQGYSFISMSHPYCSTLREILYLEARKTIKKVFPSGVVVVIQGPRFSTLAEGKLFSKQGWDVINMTQYPECSFARELGVCYAALAFITDYNVGVKSEFTMERENFPIIDQMIKTGAQKTKEIFRNILKGGTVNISCDCAEKAAKSNEWH